jgi:hypothetical protein
VFLIAGFLAGNYYKLALKDSLKYSSEDLRSIDPEFSSVKWKFITGYILLMITIFLLIIFGSRRFFDSLGKLILPAIMSLSIYNSLFALFMNVYPTPSKYNLNTFIYDLDSDIKKTALIQLAIDAAVCVVGIVFL